MKTTDQEARLAYEASISARSRILLKESAFPTDRSFTKVGNPPLPGGIDVIFFDVGHTLVHSDRRHARAVVREVTEAVHQHVCTLGFQPPPLSRYLRSAKWRFLAAAVWSRLMRREVCVLELTRRAHLRLGIELDADQMRDLAMHGAIAIWDLFAVDPEARPMLDALASRGYRLGLISNTWLPGVMFDGFLKHEGLLDFFPVRVYSSEVGFMKPDRRIFDHALRAMNTTADKCIYIGDRLDNDIRGARGVGMRTIHFAQRHRWTFRPGTPDHVVSRLLDIPDVLSSLA